jgi:hypothetical protein
MDPARFPLILTDTLRPPLLLLTDRIGAMKHVCAGSDIQWIGSVRFGSDGYAYPAKIYFGSVLEEEMATKNGGSSLSSGRHLAR